MEKGLEKKSFLNNLELLFSARAKVLNSFKSRLFPIKYLDKIPTREPAAEPAADKTPAKSKRSKSKLQLEFIANEKDINDEIFWDYFKYQNPSFLAKDLIRATPAKNKQIVNNVNDEFIDIRNDINRKEIPENENPKKVVGIVQKFLDFNKQQKGKGIN